MIKRGLEIIGSDLSLCGPLNSTKREVVDYVMSRVIGSSLDALERRKVKEKNKSKTCSSSTGPIDLPASSYGLSSQIEFSDEASLAVQKRNRIVLTSEDDGSIMFSFLAESSAFSDPGMVVLGEGLLFSEERARYQELGQELQGAILQKDEAIRQVRRVRSLQDVNTSLHGENKMLTIGTMDADLAAKKAMDKLAEMVTENLSLKEELAGLKESLEAHISSLENL
ncbi:hypothetical protein Adt_03197 [Abeliophyllum distichum]|uniref:Uncharacterized protein n=1 Tax=Abeliophyllum distichum TaxID=126358 RepID=A0ABD1VXU4_9LAMI